MTTARTAPSVAAGARITLASQTLRLFIQLGGLVVLSRLLDPADFGLVAMVASIITIAALVADFGLWLAAIQAPTLTSAQKSTLLLLNAAAGLVAGGAVAALGPVLALFYDEPRLTALAAVLAVPLVLTSIAVQFRVEINRAGRFGVLAAHDVTSAAAGLTAAIAAALAGWSYWAIAVQPLVQAVVLLTLAIAQARWMPRRPGPLRDVRELIAFGANNLGLHVANLVSTTTDVMAVGRAQGTVELGLYSRASQLITMVFTQIGSPLTRVLIPRLAAATDPYAFGAALARVQRVLAFGLLGVVSLAAAAAPAGAIVVFGADWAGVGPLLQLLCIGATFQSLGYIAYWALLARARTGMLLAAELPGRIVMIVGTIAVAGIGTPAVAAAMSVGQIVIFAGSMLALHRADIRVAPLLRAAAPAIVLAATAFTAATTIAFAVPSDPLLELILVLSVWAVAAGATLAIPAVRHALVSTLREVRA